MRFFIYGIVQGVGFRPAVYSLARQMGLKGFVRNNGSNVEICVDKKGEEFIERLIDKLPPLARIERVVSREDNTDYSQFPHFLILESKNGTRSSSIPVDTALCDHCLRDLLTPGNRRYLYPFTNCTNCGARYSVIRDLPYDRKNTSMAEFPLCPMCENEYGNPENRRFHAQTISCPECGPEYTLYNTDGKLIPSPEPFRYFSSALENGKTGVLKSWGGMHILSSFEELPNLRERYGRKEKPFALMFRDMKTIMKYAVVSDAERNILCSPVKPIVLVKKRPGFDFLDWAAPGLDYIGAMLPYSAAHHILFHYFHGDGFVATSANLPGEAMLTTNDEAFSLGMDLYLLHNREIVQRVDDSLVKVYEEKTSVHPLFIRKSRGHVPEPISFSVDGQIVAVGAERNVTGALLHAQRLFLTQYIGNTRNYSNRLFLEKALRHLMKLTGLDKPRVVVRDLHPSYATNRVAKMFSQEFSAFLLSVQHHHAHAASLMLDAGVDEIVALTLDGSGYGTDGTIWGGEVLYTNGSCFERIATLKQMPMPGGDAAVIYPERMVFAIGELINHSFSHFPTEIERILRTSMKNAPKTTSMGRVLDVLSCLLGAGCARTYDGEPAMRLEPFLEQGKYLPQLMESADIISEKGISVVNQLMLFSEMAEILKVDMTRQKRADLAVTFVHRIIEGLVKEACEFANENGIQTIGITGGVAYSIPILRMFGRMVRERGLTPVFHEKLPPGDGGISAGQVFVAAMENRE